MAVRTAEHTRVHIGCSLLQSRACAASNDPAFPLSFKCPGPSLWTDMTRCCCTICSDCSRTVLPLSPPWQCAQPGQLCFILIAYFRLKKLVFLDYFDVEMGAGEQFTFIRLYAPPPPLLFCANSRIPIYILAMELNYCKHLCGPARHNRLAGSCIMSVPPTGQLRDCTIVHSRHVCMASGSGSSSAEWAPRLFAGWLEYLLN